MFRTVRSHDGRVELDEIKATCDRHADLCQQYAKCSLDLQMNDAQLEILSETAENLRQRHAQIRKNIDEKPHSAKELEALEAEVASVIRQVAVWTMELEEVNANRLQIEIESEEEMTIEEVDEDTLWTAEHDDKEDEKAEKRGDIRFGDVDVQKEMIRFLQLGSELKKSVTCVQLASIDFELIQLRHNERWRRFLADHVPSDKLLTLAKVPS